MLLFHQIGHNPVWNINSFLEDKAGDGLIMSPVNIDMKKIVSEFSAGVKELSYFDPQFYLFDQPKSKLSTYSFFPGNIKNNFKTEDLLESSKDIATKCLTFQIENNFKYLVIPARYFDNFPTKYYDQYLISIINPFVECYNKFSTNKKLLLTLIIKPNQIVDGEAIESLMNRITTIPTIHGIYLIFENNITSKQLKNTGYLYNALLFIHYLKMNNLEVHIGYNNTEGFLLTIANPDSISMGSYENVRNFGTRRFEIRDKNKQAAPRARLYFSNLLQWIDFGYLSALQVQYKNFGNIFEDSKYKPLMFKSDYNWHFTKPEPYKHFFLLFSNQIKLLPQDQDERIKFVANKIDYAMENFKDIRESGILLNEDSDGSHLSFWRTSLNMFKKYKEDNEAEFLL